MSDETEQNTNGEAIEPAPEPEAAEAGPARKIEELEDKYRRAMADMANLHRRFQREREQIDKRAVARFVEKLLPMADNISHALKAAHESHDPAALIGGFQQIENQMLQIFQGSNIQPIETVGKPFDPEVHHAVVTEPTDDVPPGTVTAELGRGFSLDGLVIRAAQVKVAAAKTDE
jgi:molecular chaperone GrpE